MKKAVLLIILLTSRIVFSQINLTDFKTIFYQEVSYENEDYKLFIVRSFSTIEAVKIKLRIFNKTKDVLLVNPNEIVFNIKGKAYTGNGKSFTIQPDGADDKVIDVTDLKNDMKCDEFELTLNGFYKLPLESEVYIVPETPLPPIKKSDVVAENISCKLIDCKMDEEKSFAKYNCIYNGDKIAILDPLMCVAIMSDGKENKCTAKKTLTVLENGQTGNLFIEFKRLKGSSELTDGISVKWNETFKISSPIPLKIIKVPMKADLEKSINK